MENNSVDIQEIMKEIRERAREIAYAQPVPFEKNPAQRGPSRAQSAAYDAELLSEAQWSMKEGAQIPYYRPVKGGPIRRFFRKLMRKCCFFLIQPMSEEIGEFNNAAAQAVEQLCAFAEAQEEQNRRQQERIEALERRLAALEKDASAL